GVVGPAVADEVDPAVLGDHTVAQRAGQTGVALAADLHRSGAALGDGVVDHHTVHRAEGALVVAVVVAPVAHLDDGEALSDQGVQERLRGHGWGHQAPPTGASGWMDSLNCAYVTRRGTLSLW